MKQSSKSRRASSQPPANLRKPDALLKLSRSPTIERMVIKNYYNKTVDSLEKVSNYPRLMAFLSRNVWPWIWNYLKFAFTPRVRFPTYADSKVKSKSGVYKIKPRTGANAIRIAIASDWGNGTNEAWTIGKLMGDSNPDFTIHLGDVYYVGDKAEIEQNCLGRKRNGYDGVIWPKGAQGSFALNGNHEMYANGGAYFHTFLETLGMKGDTEGQLASFFCLDADEWRIIAIDTGYNSIGIPILSLIPGINDIPFIGGNCHLEQSLIDWLRDVVKLKDNPKATLLLSHHNYLTAFSERVYTKPAKQLVEFFKDQEFVWIWGHEHRLGIYDKFTTTEGLTVYGRCLGNGGMPIEMTVPAASGTPLRFYDTRTHKLDDGSDVGQNGFVNITIQKNKLILDYVDIDNTKLLNETFTTDNSGKLAYSFKDPGVLKQLA